MDRLSTLAEEVRSTVANHDGSWKAQMVLLDSIETLRIAAMGPADYVANLRYQVRHVPLD